MFGTLQREGILAVVAVGGEDALGVARKLWKVVGAPKTVDNDLSGTDYTFGFDTAVAIATELHLVDPRLYEIAGAFFG